MKTKDIELEHRRWSIMLIENKIQRVVMVWECSVINKIKKEVKR